MFRFEGFCEDKNATKIMYAVTGLAIDFRIVPVINAKVKEGKLVAETSGDAFEMLVEWIQKNKIKELTSTQTQEFMRSVGRSPASWGYVIEKALEAKIIKRVGRGKYQVTGAK